MSCSPHFCVHHLSYTYPDGSPALHDICLNLHPGEAVALVGGNGAGKSTLLLHLTGCLLPPPGTLSMDTVPIDKKQLENLRKKVGMVFQNPDDQLFMPTVYDDVAFGPQNMGLSSAEVQERVHQALAVVGAEKLAQRPPYKLSGGEKRLVAIASVLAMEPHTLVFDEPTSNLDPRARRQFIRLLQTMHHTRLIATHDLDLVLELCPRTIIMREGRIHADGPTRELFADATLLEHCHLEQPLAFSCRSHSA